jgi:hypothetical protein
MMPPERMRRQSSRLFWPGGSIRTSMTATGTVRILAQLPRLSREQSIAGSIQTIARTFRRGRRGGASFDPQVERNDQTASQKPFQQNLERIALCGAEVTLYGNRRRFQLAFVERPLPV